MATNDDIPGSRPIEADVLDFAQTIFGYVRTGNIEAMTPLLKQGLPTNLRNQKGDSLLMLASYHGHRALTGLLLDHGADPELGNDRGQMPLGAAAFKGDLPIVTMMLDKGAAVEGAGPDGRTALMLAAMFNRLPILELLLARGADPAATDAEGRTAAELALAMGASDTAAQLRSQDEAQR